MIFRYYFSIQAQNNKDELLNDFVITFSGVYVEEMAIIQKYLETQMLPFTIKDNCNEKPD